ncbi:ABC transporter ATP-binding protein [Jhaorihella thermophila]|uniref:Branched-chain amino acid transport system ATP-binding protein n=1 Tax=Jhaorihella thermophila TaxID=488547 RepID=A0A1H5T5E2_9RHOB|nr:ABC transporter ATP-binding protein [Jhaorihella thermophila]SEF57378.1 branched-chain amino acid transport system ATP-binding protein [Jhaorihella thermophila]
MTVLLSTRGLSKHFSGLHAVENVDFDLPAGQIRALIGPNGAGKTTFVGMLCGRITPSAGAVIFDGQDISHLPAHRRIRLGMAYTFQITSVFPGLSVAENVALAARPHLRGEAEVAAAVQDALDRVGLGGRTGQVAGDLSYGHQRLLEIAMGIAQAPRLLILDEPTQGLSDGEIAAFKALIRDLSATTTILLIEHNMSVVMETADMVTVMNFGAILAEGRPEEIRADPAVQAAYLGTDADAGT